MAKTTTELLLERVEMATNNGDSAEEIPDDAVANHIGPVEAYRHWLTVAVDNHRHHIAGAQIHPSHSGDSVAAGVWLHSVAAVCRRGVSHCSSCAICYSLNNAKRID